MEENKKIKFADATLSLLNHTFGLTQYVEETFPALQKWVTLAEQQEAPQGERAEILRQMQLQFKRGGSGWNEVELESKFIAPLFGLTNIEDKEIGYFMERPLEAEVQGVMLFGTVDGLIARGSEDPELPYFCMQEFKRSLENKGRPNGQVLASMLAAQALNKNSFPIYGLYVVGASWHFVVLEGKEYVISKTYAADGEALFTIFKMLKALKILIVEAIHNK
jgi:hypothetical protein